MLRALIFVPRVHDAARWWKETIEYCQARGYTVVAIVARLEDLKTAAVLQHAALVVLARRAHLLPELPLEVVSEQADRPGRNRRPQRRTWVPPL